MKKRNQDSTVQEHPNIAVKTAIPKIESIPDYQYKETRDLVQLVKEAADLLRVKGEEAFKDFQLAGSRWRKEETYVFVLDPLGNMLVHPDPELEGKNQMALKDINGKLIIRGLIGAATTFPDKPEGWYHYQWAVPGGLFPRWKSSYVQLVRTASGKDYIVGSGVYNDRMEREFVVDLVKNAVEEIGKRGKDAFTLFRDPTGPYLTKDTYVFVTDMNAVGLVNPAFPNLEGLNLMDLKDANGKYLNREMIQLVKNTGFGWVDYMWPKPGDSVPTLKSAYVQKARFGNEELMVGCGVYLADASRETKPVPKMDATELMTLVRQAADILKVQGENAYPEFRTKGSKWFHEDTYLFVFTLDGKRAFHAAEPETEGRDDLGLMDIQGRPIVKMILEAASGPFDEGWVHYMYPEPGNIFPTWKSSFVKRVTFPSGNEYIVGCGIYNMQMNRIFIEDMVNRAAGLVEKRGQQAFDLFRDKKGPFFFMDTYVFVQNPEGIELVNPALPSLEGRNLINLKDLDGKSIIKDEIEIAMTDGAGWLDLNWYQPGNNRPAHKQTYVRKAQHNGEVYVVGSGLYGEAGQAHRIGKSEIQKILWQSVKEEILKEGLSRQVIFGEKGTLAKFSAKRGAAVARHYHINEEYTLIVSGAMKYKFDDRELEIRVGETLVVPPNTPHSIVVLEDAVFFIFFAPVREDWQRGEDKYLRN